MPCAGSWPRAGWPPSRRRGRCSPPDPPLSPPPPSSPSGRRPSGVGSHPPRPGARRPHAGPCRGDGRRARLRLPWGRTHWAVGGTGERAGHMLSVATSSTTSRRPASPGSVAPSHRHPCPHLRAHPSTGPFAPGAVTRCSTSSPTRSTIWARSNTRHRCSVRASHFSPACWAPLNRPPPPMPPAPPARS